MGGPVQKVLIQPFRVKIGPVYIKGIFETGVVNAVSIFLFDAGADGVEILRNFHRLPDSDVLRGMGVDGIGHPVNGNPALRAEVGHVPLRVDPGVRPAAAREVDGFPADLGNGPLQGLADGGSVLLHLPAVVSGPVVGEFQGDVAHRFSSFFRPGKDGPSSRSSAVLLYRVKSYRRPYWSVQRKWYSSVSPSAKGYVQGSSPTGPREMSPQYPE